MKDRIDNIFIISSAVIIIPLILGILFTSVGIRFDFETNTYISYGAILIGSGMFFTIGLFIPIAYFTNFIIILKKILIKGKLKKDYGIIAAGLIIFALQTIIILLSTNNIYRLITSAH